MRLYYGTYGHHLSGKLYVYWGDDNLRTGQQVVAPVTHYRSGKNYNTMFTIARVQSEKNAQGEVNRLAEDGVFIKTISGRDLLSLPGGREFESKSEWKRDSDRRYRQKFGLPAEDEPKKAVSSRKISGTAKSTQTAEGHGGKGKASAKTVARLLGEAAKQIKAPDAARKSLLNNKIAADSFRARERLKELRQRDAFIED